MQKQFECSMQKKLEALSKNYDAYKDKDGHYTEDLLDLPIEDIYEIEADLLDQLNKKCEQPGRIVRSPEAFLDRWDLWENDNVAINALLEAAEKENPSCITADQFYKYYKEFMYEDSHDEDSEKDVLQELIGTLERMLGADGVATLDYVLI